MTKKDILYKEIEGFPENMLDEVLDFVEYLKLKVSKDKLEATLLGELALKKDWLLPEEDEAWKNL
jgi:hypothetical protein